MPDGLSFDPRHHWLPACQGSGGALTGVEWALEVFTTEDVFTPDPSATAFDGDLMVADGLRWLGGQRQCPGAVRGRVERADDTVRWQFSVDDAAGAPVKGIKLLIRGLPRESLGTGWWSPTTPADTTLTAAPGHPVQLDYPWPSWQTPWVGAGDGPGLTISARDDRVRAHRFFHYLPHWSEQPVTEIVCDALATERAPTFESSEIRLRLCDSAAAMGSDLEAHLAWVEQAHGVMPFDRRPDVPAWFRDVDLVVTLHGQHWTGHVFNTFDRMAEILEDLTADIDGRRVLAYLPGWEGRYYWQYPVYRPGADLGGPAGFRHLVDAAHRLGIRVMPMIGANGANVHRFPQWRDAALRSPSDTHVALVNAPDWDNDRAPEDQQVFLNPGEPTFRAHLVDQVRAVVDGYGVDAVLLDTSACWFNDPRHNVVDGYRALVGEISRRYPDLLVCGEGWYDALLSVFPASQTWLPIQHRQRFPGLPLRYARLLGHLAAGAPGAGSTGVYEAGTGPVSEPLNIAGFIPALPVVEDTFSAHRAAVRGFCQSLRSR